MWPWAHVGAAYLLLAGACWLGWQRRPSGVEALAAVFGALAPDLIDKPLAWRFGVLPYGRTLAHSLLIGGVAVLAIGVIARRFGRGRAFGAFAVGYVAHLAGDAYQPLLAGSWADLFFLAWPVIAAPESEVSGVVTQLTQIEPTPFFLLGLAITLAGGVAWWKQGRPGVSAVRERLLDPSTG